MAKYLKFRTTARSGLANVSGRIVRMLLTLAFCASHAAVSGDQILISASPPLGKERIDRIMSAVAARLEGVTGKDFEYVPAAHWPGYIEDMRGAKYSLLLDEPHLVSWRIRHQGHVPIARLPGETRFVIASMKSDEDIVQLADVAGHIVCAGVPPALDGLILFAQFGNPLRQPVLVPANGSEEPYQRLREGGCRAAVLPAASYDTLPGNERDALRILYLSDGYPNLTLSADGRLPAPLLEAIRRALLDPGLVVGDEAAGGDDPAGIRLVPASAPPYQGLDRLLDGSWGLR